MRPLPPNGAQPALPVRAVCTAIHDGFWSYEGRGDSEQGSEIPGHRHREL